MNRTIAVAAALGTVALAGLALAPADAVWPVNGGVDNIRYSPLSGPHAPRPACLLRAATRHRARTPFIAKVRDATLARRPARDWRLHMVLTLGNSSSEMLLLRSSHQCVGVTGRGIEGGWAF